MSAQVDRVDVVDTPPLTRQGFKRCLAPTLGGVALTAAPASPSSQGAGSKQLRAGDEKGANAHLELPSFSRSPIGPDSENEQGPISVARNANEESLS